MQLSLSYQTVHLNRGFLVCIPNKSPVSFMRFRNGITSCIELDSAIYSFSVVLSAISVCSLLHHVIGHPAYIIRNPVRDNTDSGDP